MLTKQISIFVENRAGRVSEICQILADAGINLYGLTIADTAEFGVMRCLSDETERALEVLKQNGVVAKTQDTLVVEVPDEPGGLAHVLSVLTAAGINIEYLYSFVHTKHGTSNILFKLAEPEHAAQICKENGISVVCGKELRAHLPEE